MSETWRPVVTVVVPMLDELGFVDACLDGFAAQTYPSELLDVVVVDGGSTDGSRQLVDRRADGCGWLRVVDNPDRRASAAFNRGTEAAEGEVVCLFSAHGVPDSTYVERSVEVLEETGAAGVGGRYEHVGLDPTSAAIGLAMASPFGMASPHRYADRRTDVDTISHPAYRRDAMADVGRFDESLLRNSDYEFNHRMLGRGHRLVFDPTVSSLYRPRRSLSALARQFWWYGWWKARVLRRHPGSLRARHLVPPVAVAVVAASPLLVTRRGGRRLLAAFALGYTGLVAATVHRASPRSHGADAAVLTLSFPVMHGAWGSGFLASVVEDLLDRGRA